MRIDVRRFVAFLFGQRRLYQELNDSRIEAMGEVKETDKTIQRVRHDHEALERVVHELSKPQ